MIGKIKGLGSYLPSKVLSNKDLEEMVETSDEWIVERTGIRERRIADPYKETVSKMACEAGKHDKQHGNSFGRVRGAARSQCG